MIDRLFIIHLLFPWRERDTKSFQWLAVRGQKCFLLCFSGRTKLEVTPFAMVKKPRTAPCHAKEKGKQDSGSKEHELLQPTNNWEAVHYCSWLASLLLLDTTFYCHGSSLDSHCWSRLSEHFKVFISWISFLRGSSFIILMTKRVKRLCAIETIYAWYIFRMTIIENASINFAHLL